MNQRELTEIIGSWLVISVAFGWVRRGAIQAATAQQSFLLSLVIALVAVGTGFIFHELAHKYAAIRYGAHAEFFSWPLGLGIALLMAFGLGTVFAAPGAVYIFAAHLSKKQNGIISLVGPLVNIALGLIFFLLAVLTLPLQNEFLSLVGFQASIINFFLAGFNLLPLGPLDGKKVFDWNKGIWAAFFLPMLFIFLFVSI